VRGSGVCWREAQPFVSRNGSTTSLNVDLPSSRVLFAVNCCTFPMSVTLQMGHFLYAAKAFDVLERLDPDPEYWEGKRGACVGVFQLVIAGKGSKEDLQDVLTMVRNTSNPQVHYSSIDVLKCASYAEYRYSSGGGEVDPVMSCVTCRHGLQS